MTKSKNTKRALLASVLSLILCAAMLVGSTLAWFTDSVTSGKNKIVAGNLDVELTHTNAKVTDDKVNEDTKLFTDKNGDPIKWEPGVMAYENFTVANVGSLALKYTLKLNVSAFNKVQGTEKSLKDVLKVALVENGFTGDRTAALNLNYNKTIEEFEYKGNMPAGADSKTYGIVIYWEPSDVDNDYNLNNGTKADDNTDQLYIELGINLSAWQDTVENDSFGNNYDEKADDPFALADAAALAADPKNSFRTADGRYWQYPSQDAERALLSYLISHSMDVTLIRDVGAPASGVASQTANYNGQHSVLDLNGNTYLSGGLEFKNSTKANDSNVTIKNGTMESSINSQDILKFYNSIQSVTLDNVNLKWTNPQAWNADTNNYRGLNLSADTAGAVFTVSDSVLDCNASFYTNTNFSNAAERPNVNITGTTVNGRLTGQSVNMTVTGCNVNGEVYCNGSWSSTTTVNIKDSTVNGNAYFDASSSQKNNVTIENTTINGNLQTNSIRNNVTFTLINATVTGTLSYTDMPSWKIPADKVIIVSGTFGFDPTNYLAAGSTAADNGNGTWTVTAG